MLSKHIAASLFACAALFGVGCKSMGFMAGSPSAICTLAPVAGSSTTGRVAFTQKEDGILVEAELYGLAPGKHGIHIHEHGDCGNSAEAAGGHFNPTMASHGGAAMQMSHEGDLGNITADAKGHGRMSVMDRWLKLSGDHGILGRSIIVHAQEDDLVSQPSGNAGSRVACGLITASVR